MSPDLIDAAVANGAKGLVIAGVGDGNMTTPAVDAVKRALAKGVVVVRSSRVGEGVVRRNIELNDDTLGTVASKELNPAKSRVLLKLALTRTSDARRCSPISTSSEESPGRKKKPAVRDNPGAAGSNGGREGTTAGVPGYFKLRVTVIRVICLPE